MVKIRRDKSNHVTILDQQLVRDSRLSWKARGIFAYLWSQADEWEFSEVEVSRHAKDGRDSLRSGLNELEQYGYLDRKRVRNNAGQVSSSKWILHEKPMLENHTQENPTQENGTQRYHQEKITSKKDNIKRSNSQAGPDNTSHIRKEVIEYLNQKLGTSYKSNASKNKTVINARVNEGYTVEDFKTVINNKVNDWGSDSKMSKYLRPETLFGTKFDSYLNEKQINSQQPTHQGKDWFAGFNRE